MTIDLGWMGSPLNPKALEVSQELEAFMAVQLKSAEAAGIGPRGYAYLAFEAANLICAERCLTLQMEYTKKERLKGYCTNCNSTRCTCKKG